jgi:glycosyltransferase involved in cell wall biosynthesis
MNVLVVSEPGVDGVFRYVDTLCHFLWEQGIGVHLAYSDRRSGDRLQALVSEVTAHGGRTLNLKTANRPELADRRAFGALLNLAREVRPDVIHTHSSKAGFLGRALRLCGIRAVQCYHPHAYVGMRPHGGRFDVIYNLIESVMGRIANTIVVSADEAAFARNRLRIPSSRLHLIPNGVDLDAFSPVPAAERKRLRQQFGLPEGTLVLGCMGRSSEQKDPVTLYRAFARAAAERRCCTSAGANSMARSMTSCGSLDWVDRFSGCLIRRGLRISIVQWTGSS